MFLVFDGKEDKRIIMIAGPTAVGKTAVGVFLAQRLAGEIVSCDSMQLYQGITIASNKPTAEERQEVTHHLIDMVPLTENFDVVAFERTARACIEEILRRGKLPIVVGGTGMYMKVLLDGIFESGEVPEEIRNQLESEMSQNGAEAMYKELETVDSQAAQKIHPHDARRIIRALEVYRFTGKPISELQQQTKGLWGTYPVFLFGLNMDRDQLYQRIDDRVEAMCDQGLLEEVKKVQGITLSKTAQAIIGLKEMTSFLSGQCSLQEAKEQMKKNTRHLAKRQLTWFRVEERLQWIDMTGPDAVEHAVGNIERVMADGS